MNWGVLTSLIQKAWARVAPTTGQCSAALFGVALLSQSCALTATFQPKVQQEGKYLVHIVSEPNETLGQIASWYADGAQSESAILNANPGTNFSELKRGDRVLIPYAVVKKVDALGSEVQAAHEGGEPLAAQPAVSPPADTSFFENSEQLPQSPTATSKSPVALDPLEELANQAQRATPTMVPEPIAGTPSQGSLEKQELETFDLQGEEEEPPPQANPHPADQSVEMTTSEPSEAPRPNEPTSREPTLAAAPRTTSLKTLGGQDQGPAPSEDVLRRDLGLAQ